MSQDDYLTNASAGSNTCAHITASNKANAAYVGNTTASNCSGDLNQGSLLADYQFNKHFDIYGGVSYSEAGGGLASGFLQSNTAVFVTGTRLNSRHCPSLWTRLPQWFVDAQRTSSP